MTPRKRDDEDAIFGGGPWTAGTSLASTLLRTQGITGFLLTAVLLFGMWFGVRSMDETAAFRRSQEETNVLLRESSARQEAELRAIREQQATDHARNSEKLDILIGRQSAVLSVGPLLFS